MKASEVAFVLALAIGVMALPSQRGRLVATRETNGGIGKSNNDPVVDYVIPIDKRDEDPVVDYVIPIDKRDEDPVVDYVIPIDK
ncbi:hypothetical protein LZ30DRAFT_814584 [Colletotrichum cereale]|nr:hypothetical protein LZ30DRAFT_814584 [Colletotrichum cereale]